MSKIKGICSQNADLGSAYQRIKLGDWIGFIPPKPNKELAYIIEFSNSSVQIKFQEEREQNPKVKEFRRTRPSSSEVRLEHS